MRIFEIEQLVHEIGIAAFHQFGKIADGMLIVDMVDDGRKEVSFSTHSLLSAGWPFLATGSFSIPLSRATTVSACPEAREAPRAT